MQNTKVRKDRIAALKKEGWKVSKAGYATKGSRSFMVAPDGQYSPHFPLPPADANDINSEHVAAARRINSIISSGGISFKENPGYIPAVWIDYEGLRRNRLIYAAAKRAIISKLNANQYYVRDGRKFIRAVLKQ